MKKNIRRLRKTLFLCLIVMLFTLMAYKSVSSAAERITFSTDIYASEDHEEITWELIRMVEHNQELKVLLETAIRQAADMNPDLQTNPVRDLESYYDFIDWSIKAMPWEISPQTDYVSLYDRIDQSMGCFYFICDQPLKELEGKGYYNNSLIYHEPFRTWLIHFTSEYGAYLNEESSWNEEYYQNALSNPDFHLDDNTYETPENWVSFNDFFARKLRDPSVRPIASPDDNSVVIFPADSEPQGLWRIDEHNYVIQNTEDEAKGVAIKTGTLMDIPSLLEGSEYADSFSNGYLTHTFLDVNDYHRYHFPVSGTVKEVYVTPGDDAPGGVITWDADAKRYKEYYSEQYGWQSIETRGVLILEMDRGGLVAIVPVGMCEVSSVNFEAAVVPGAKVQKGDPMGYFLFGGSDIIMIFSEETSFEMQAEPKEHRLMGETYGLITGGVTAEEGSTESKPELKYWTEDSAAAGKIKDFVRDVVNPDSERFVPKEDRIAVFDFDGTLYGERFPTYFDTCLFLYRALHDESYEAPEETRVYAQALEEALLSGAPEPDSPRSTAQMCAEMFRGMTIEEYHDYIRNFMEIPAWGFEGMNYGEGYFMPMVSVVEYLSENGFTVFISSGSERAIVRELIKGKLDAWVPSYRVIGSTFSLMATGQNGKDGRSYTFKSDDDVLLEGNLVIKNQKMNKVFSIVDEIGKTPVLVFGNSSGDIAMGEYAVQHGGAAFMLLCDDTERDYGDEEVAKEFAEACGSFELISMKNDFAAIYKEGAVKNVSEEQEETEEEPELMNSESEELPDAA